MSQTDERRYGKDSQIFTFGVHGTANSPENIRGLTEQMSAATSKTNPGGKNLVDASFSWEGRSGQLNQPEDRTKAAGEFSKHVLGKIDEAIRDHKLDPNKPLTLNLVGFSHGGNVAIQATKEIAEGLDHRGFKNSAVHLTTVSTPAYTMPEEKFTGINPNPQPVSGLKFGDRGSFNTETVANREDPATLKNINTHGHIQINHLHLHPKGDGVRVAALGDATYPKDNGITVNLEIHGSKKAWGMDGIANHGAPQDGANPKSGDYKDGKDSAREAVSAVVKNFERMQNQSYGHKRADSGTEAPVASNAVPGAAPSNSSDSKSSVVASNTGNSFENPSNQLNKIYEQTLAGVKAQGVNANEKDVAAALVQQGMQNGFKANSNDQVSVVAGKNGLIAFQGEPGNPATPTASVNPSNVQANSAPTVAQALTQQYAPTMQVAFEDQQQKQPKSMAMG